MARRRVFPAGKQAAIALLVWLCLPPLARSVDELPPLEYRVKAAFLLNFTKFVEWPAAAFADDRAPFRICVLGEDPFGSVLDQMVKDEVMGGRRLMVQRISRPPEPKSCQVVFVSRQEKATPPALGPGVLTVGEGEEFLREGGMIAFVIENRRVRFDISQKAAAGARLTISSRLLNVARLVEK
jgi:hypothetical protein